MRKALVLVLVAMLPACSVSVRSDDDDRTDEDWVHAAGDVYGNVGVAIKWELPAGTVRAEGVVEWTGGDTKHFTFEEGAEAASVGGVLYLRSAASGWRRVDTGGNILADMSEADVSPWTSGEGPPLTYRQIDFLARVDELARALATARVLPGGADATLGARKVRRVPIEVHPDYYDVAPFAGEKTAVEVWVGSHRDDEIRPYRIQLTGAGTQRRGRSGEGDATLTIDFSGWGEYSDVIEAPTGVEETYELTPRATTTLPATTGDPERVLESAARTTESARMTVEVSSPNGTISGNGIVNLGEPGAQLTYGDGTMEVRYVDGLFYAKPGWLLFAGTDHDPLAWASIGIDPLGVEASGEQVFPWSGYNNFSREVSVSDLAMHVQPGAVLRALADAEVVSREEIFDGTQTRVFSGSVAPEAIGATLRGTPIEIVVWVDNTGTGHRPLRITMTRTPEAAPGAQTTTIDFDYFDDGVTVVVERPEGAVEVGR